MKARRSMGALIALGVLALAACGSTQPGQSTDQGKKFKIALSMSYSGNQWQSVTRNIALAVAKLPADKGGLRDKVQLDVFVAGANPQTQISQLQQMIAKGYQGILMYPISPTALNRTIKQACDKGIKVWTYDANVTEPCAYNMGWDQEAWGTKTAEYLAEAMGGTGNITMITGVPGTSPDTQRNTGVEKTMAAKGISILDKCPGMWQEGPAAECMSKQLAANDKINGVWASAGADAAVGAFEAAGRKLVPMISEAENGWRLMLADPKYQAAGLKGASYGSPQWEAAAALQLMVQQLEGKTDIPHFYKIDPDWVTQEQVRVCKTGTVEELKAGCNTFPADLVPSGFFADWYSEKWSPNVDLQMALTGEVPSTQ